MQSFNKITNLSKFLAFYVDNAIMHHEQTVNDVIELAIDIDDDNERCYFDYFITKILAGMEEDLFDVIGKIFGLLNNQEEFIIEHLSKMQERLDSQNNLTSI